VRIRTNQLDGSTRRALVLDASGTEYVLGEASASGDACASLQHGRNSGGAVGSTSGTGSKLGPGIPGASGSGLGAASGGVGGSRGNRLAASKLALQCPARRLTLIDVLKQRRRVALLGAVDASLAGRTVTIMLGPNNKRVGTAVVGSDGFFGTTLPPPPHRLRLSNKVSYQARIGTLRSPHLSLNRPIRITSISSTAGKVSIRGRMTRRGRRLAILIQRRVSCSSVVTVKQIRSRRNGTFTVTITAPRHARAAVCLATTSVRQRTRGLKAYRSMRHRMSTRPRVVVIH
jgi:hypothetical protein